MSQYEDRKLEVQDHPDLPPPSYIEATLFGSQTRSNALKDNPLHGSLEQLLERLPVQLRAARQDQLGQQQDDERLLAESFTPHIAEFLHKLPTSVFYPQPRQKPMLAELILSPANAVPATQGWALSDLDQRKEHAAYVQVVEVDLSENKKLETSDRKLPGAFDEIMGGDQGNLMWWRKEDLAHHLASRIKRYLEPEGNTEASLRTSADNEVNNGLQQKGNQGSSRYESYENRRKSPASLFSGHGKKVHASTNPREIGSHSHSGNLTGVVKRNAEGVKVSVQAEKVTFRRENDMGLWESSSGWAIILIVTAAH